MDDGLTYEVVAPWPYDAREEHNAHLYPGVVVTVTWVTETPDTTQVRVTGPLEHVAHWVLVEYCGGDPYGADDVMNRCMHALRDVTPWNQMPVPGDGSHSPRLN